MLLFSFPTTAEGCFQGRNPCHFCCAASETSWVLRAKGTVPPCRVRTASLSIGIALSCPVLVPLSAGGQSQADIPMRRNRTLLRAEGDHLQAQVSQPFMPSLWTQGGSRLSPPSQGHRGLIAAAYLQPSSWIYVALALTCLLRGAARRHRDATGELSPSGGQRAAKQDTHGKESTSLKMGGLTLGPTHCSPQSPKY